MIYGQLRLFTLCAREKQQRRDKDIVTNKAHYLLTALKIKLSKGHRLITAYSKSSLVKGSICEIYTTINGYIKPHKTRVFHIFCSALHQH